MIRQTAVLFGLTALGVAFGCNGGSGSSTAGQSVAPVSSAPITTGTTPITSSVAPIVTPVVVTVTSRFVYTADSGTDSVTPFTIDPKTGVLKAGTAVPSATGTWAIAMDPKGRYLYVLGLSDIASFAIDDKTGALTQIAGQTITLTGGSTWNIACDPTGSFVFVADSDNLSSFKIGANGALSNAGTVALTGNDLREMTFDSAGKFCYVVGNAAGNITCVAIEAGTGNLKVASTVMGSPSVRPIAMDPAGKFVFVGSISASNDVQVFSRDPATGALKAVAASTVLSGPCYGVTVDATGKFLYCACDSNGNATSAVNQFSIDATGKLTALTPPTAPGTDFPVDLVIDNSGQFAYAANFGFGASPDSVTAFSIDQKTHALTAMGTPVSAGASSGPHGIAIKK